MRIKYSFLIILLLIPNLVFGGMGLGIGGRLGPNSFGIPLSLKDNLQILIYNHDLTAATLYDRANQYDFYQGTAAAKGDVTTGPPKYLALDTDEFYPLREIDDETGITAHQLATVATGARYLATGLDMSQYATESGNRQYRVVFHSAAGTAWAYAGGADSAEAFTDILPAWDFTVGWNFSVGTTINDANTFTTAGGGGAGVLKLTVFTIGKTYKVSVTLSTTAPACEIYTINDAGDMLGTKLFTGSGSAYFTAKAGWTSFYLRNTGNGTTDVTALALEEVTSFGTTALKLYNAVSGGAQSLVGNSSLDPNAITSLEVYKVIGSDNLTGDQTHGITVKLDDGQPAAAEVLFAHDSGAAGTRSVYAAVETTGKVTLYASEDGTNYETVQTDNAVFANGAATLFTDLIFVLDKTAGTGAIYVNGSAVATTETITTGAVFDTYQPFEIGAKAGASYLNGDIGSIRVLNTTVTATQAADQYNADAIQALINM